MLYEPALVSLADSDVSIPATLANGGVLIAGGIEVRIMSERMEVSR